MFDFVRTAGKSGSPDSNPPRSIDEAEIPDPIPNDPWPPPPLCAQAGSDIKIKNIDKAAQAINFLVNLPPCVNPQNYFDAPDLPNQVTIKKVW